jgi:recombination protein RecT
MNQAGERTNEITVIRHELTGMTGQFKDALPAHIPVERFCRVI